MIKFYNIRSGETRECETPEMIAAFYNSTNLHVNAMLGQDFGWRIAPETIVRMDEIRGNATELDRIAQAFSLPQGEVKDVDILAWISLLDARGKSKDVQENQAKFEKEYEEQLRQLRKQDEPKTVADVEKEEAKAQEKSTEKTDNSAKTDSAEQTDSAKINASSNDKKEKK